ncbi:N-acetylglucosamine kinase [Aestuariimicrobium kwangyangense]|uniref:N-acetylglucosamine kinase n=1 Tax=Aestuariimicrobium kwangyangense TaxID=396389 RepID=UPI0003B56844|nr:BadF/BadG/BcrA/BcrD ATPase family protein [Aestuariimicrobium kwangyangense]
MATLMALDAGQSGMRASIRVNGTEVLQTEHRGMLTDRPVVPQLAAVAHEAAALWATPESPIEVIGVGSTGLGADESAEQFLVQVADLGVRQVNLAHDSITSYLGALGHRQGAVTAAGTGVVTLAVGPSEVLRVDGWGYLIGDAGSGFWIGRAGLDAVMRAFDRRGPQTSLTAVVLADFPSLPELYLDLQQDEGRVRRIASYARVVAEHAAASDAVSREIVVRAGAELAHSAVSGLRAVGVAAEDPAVSMLGNVFGSTLVRESFVQHVRAHLPRAEFPAPRGTGLDGAALLAEVTADEALASSILRAGAGTDLS